MINDLQFISLNSVFISTDIQAALYELAWQVIKGNLKLDQAASVLNDVMVSVKPRLALLSQLSTVCTWSM